MPASCVAIIGGTGLYSLDGLEIEETREIETPYGAPSSPIAIAYAGQVKVLFLARHGLAHDILPSEINAAANIYALKSLGAQWCVSVSAVGSLQEEYAPGDVVLPTQFIDRTKTRRHTLYGDGVVVHVPFADPICPVAHELIKQACFECAEAADRRIGDRGTYVCMEGPLFSTRAESQWYRSMGASIIGMTALPEAKFAREAEISYCVMATVTDYDCWRSESADIDVPELLATLKGNVEFAKVVLHWAIPRFAEVEQPQAIANVLRTSMITPVEAISDQRKSELAVFLGKYYGDEANS